MPTHLRMRCAWQVQDANPKNQFVINPTFRRSLDLSDPTSGVDALALCTDLAAALDTWYGTGGGQLTVKAYNIQGAQPNYPLATKTNRAGTFYPALGVGQQALCLSFYADVNQPRHRGRLYVPGVLLKAVASDLGAAYANGIVRAKVAELVTIFAGLGGSNVDWGVWSSVDHAFHKATNYFVDDSWDIIRSRKLAGTTRTIGTTGG